MVVSEHVKEYSSAKEHPEWKGLADIADDILEGMRKIGLNFKLDHITGGTGNCLFVTVLQQLKRESLKWALYWTKRQIVEPLIDEMEPTLLRNLVVDFMLESPLVEEMRRIQNQRNKKGEGVHWNVFCNRNRNPSEDADDRFIQGVALFLNMDIYVTSPSHSKDRQFQLFSGHLSNSNEPKGGPCIYVGYLPLTNGSGHFQSILPNDEPLQPLESQKIGEPFNPIVWADRTKANLLNLNLNFALDEISTSQENSFIESVMHQLKRPEFEVLLSVRPFLRGLVDRMDFNGFRFALADYRIARGPDEMKWNVLYAGPKVVIDDTFIEGVAHYLLSDIHLVTGVLPNQPSIVIESGHATMPWADKTCIYISNFGNGQNENYQSVLPLYGPFETSVKLSDDCLQTFITELHHFG